VQGIPQGAILQVPLGRRHVYALGSRTLEARPDTAVLLAPGQEYTLYFEPDNCLVVLRIPGSALAVELAARDPAAARASRGTREVPLVGGRLSTLAAIHQTLVDATKPTTGNASVPQAKHLEAQLCSWMADQVLETRPSSATPALAIQRIRTVEEWVDANLANPITLGRLCAAAGVGDRYLGYAFRSHRGQTPMQFVSARRLAWVRRSLLESKPGDSVTQLAHDAGFVHLGRFAVRYRNTYGESPSATLRRSSSRPRSHRARQCRDEATDIRWGRCRRIRPVRGMLARPAGGIWALDPPGKAPTLRRSAASRRSGVLQARE
jgi:AraC-like DNA-binding protein